MSSSDVTPRNFQISMEEINRATQNLRPTNIIEDRWGYKIYRGLLSGYRTVDINRRKRNQDEKKDESIEELKIATSFHHENIITFIGYCFEGDELFKVHEYAFNGSLASYLEDDYNKHNLTWVQRLKICIGAARGLKHLHDGRVIHRNFSSFAILLDENLEAKISKFERSVLVSENQPRIQIYKSTLLSYVRDHFHEQYEDPIFRESGILCLETDVYLYGLVLFEILSGIMHNQVQKIEGYGIYNMISFVRQFYDENAVNKNKLIDRFLNDQIDNHSFHKFLEIAYKCISFNIKDRPMMDEIIKTLDEVLEIQNKPVASIIHKENLQYLDNFQIAMEDVQKATQNFSANTRINDSYDVYKGELYDSHQIIAIRKSHESPWLISTEVDLCIKLQHDNIIRFIGYNIMEDSSHLVFEYAVNGSLEKHIKDSSMRFHLTWKQRLKICIGAARGLKYLHAGLGEYKNVIHGNFHSGKILLDDKLEPKIHDFRTSFLVHKNGPPGKYGDNFDRVLRKLGYIDPLLSESKILKIEADVYSFGVVLFETLSGLPPYHLQTDPQYCTRDGEPQHLMSMVRQYHESLVDPYIRDQIDIRSLETFKETAYKCVSYNAKDRPSMSKVVKRLEEALYAQNHGGFSTINHKNKKQLEDFKIPFDEINLAIGVKDEDTHIGEGGFGVVYRGKLSECWHSRKVAIKFLQPKGNEEQMELNFRSELEMIFNFNHENIISFIGYCDEGNERIIVYDLAVNGGLDDYLEKQDNRRSLTTFTRVLGMKKE